MEIKKLDKKRLDTESLGNVYILYNIIDINYAGFLFFRFIIKKTRFVIVYTSFIRLSSLKITFKDAKKS